MAVSTPEPGMAVNIPASAPQHVYAAAAEQALAWGRTDGALEVCELGISRHPGYTGLRVFRAEALLGHDRQAEAEEDLRVALASEPQHPRALKGLCHILMEQRRYREALRFLERAEFILLGDTEVEGWLREAEARAGDEPVSAPPAVANLLYTPDVTARAKELLALPAVHAIYLESDGKKRLFGEDAGAPAKNLERMPKLEQRMGAVLEEAGLGPMAGASLQSGETLYMSHRSDRGTVRVAADTSLREGLIAWHAAKVLGGDAE